MKSENMYPPLQESDPRGERLRTSCRAVDERSSKRKFALSLRLPGEQKAQSCGIAWLHHLSPCAMHQRLWSLSPLKGRTT